MPVKPFQNKASVTIISCTHGEFLTRILTAISLRNKVPINGNPIIASSVKEVVQNRKLGQR